MFRSAIVVSGQDGDSLIIISSVGVGQDRPPYEGNKSLIGNDIWQGANDNVGWPEFF